MGEFESSNFISGNNGEYSLSEGQFVCIDPYAEAATPEDEVFNTKHGFDKKFD